MPLRDDPADASGPIHDVEVRWDVRVPVRDGLELSANLWLPMARTHPTSDSPRSSR